MAADLTPDYAASLGRIGGQLLADNLLSFQDGGDLSFDTDLLYLDVANRRIGINNYGASPNDLYIGGTNILTTTNLIVDTTYYNNNWTISSNTIANSNGIIYVTPTGTTTYGATGSLSFNGTSQYLTVPNSTSFDQTGAFTFEAWVYPTSQLTNAYIWAMNTNGFLNARFNSSGNFQVDQTGYAIAITSSSTYSINNWYHVAVSYDTISVRLFVNGSLQGSWSPSHLAAASTSLTIGNYLGGVAAYWVGSISNVRVVKGTAVYTSAFTPSTSALTAITGTQLLLNTTYDANYLADNSTFNYTVTAVSGVTSSASSPVQGPIVGYAGATIIASGVGTANLNLISSGFNNPTVNGSINLTPNGQGNVVWNGNGQINGSSTLLSVTGNTTIQGNFEADGTINFGNNNPTDTLKFTAEVNSNVLPSATLAENLGASNNIWATLYANTVTVPNITATTLNAGGIQITGNSISSINTSNDITFQWTTSGNLKLNGIYPFVGNNIVNSTTQPYTLASTSDGYWDFTNTSAIVFPVGSTSQRVVATLGATRYNTDLQYLEIYNGQTWANVIGSSPPTTAATANDLGVIYDLILG